MFGTSYTNPYSFPQVELGKCCIINPEKRNDIASDNLVSFVQMPSVSEDGIVDTSITRSFSEVKVGYTFFEENDVIFAKITPCMENGKGGIATGLMNRVGFGSTEFHILRPINEKSNSYWLYYLTMLPEFRKEAADNMTGASGHRRVPEKFMKSYKVFLPPIECQNEFADYVKSIDKLKFISLYLDIEVSEENNGLYYREE